MDKDHLIWEEEARQYLEALGSNREIFILSDQNTFQSCVPAIKKMISQSCSDIIISPGESSKSFKTLEEISVKLLNSNVSRRALLICVGGGVISDIGGLIASIFKRGIKMISIPTTILAQTDAAIGGKNGINVGDYKNQCGTFNFPEAVLFFNDILSTLPKEEIITGYAETVKHALIYDKKFWNELIKIHSADINHHKEIIKRSALIKHKIIAEDPYENNIRKKLNFGHTAGHAIESLKSFSISHGLAVSAGIIIESHLSFQSQLLSEIELVEISSYINHEFPKINFNIQDISAIIKFMENDKKNEEKKINFTLLKSIGKAEINCYPTTRQIESSLEYYIASCS